MSPSHPHAPSPTQQQPLTCLRICLWATCNLQFPARFCLDVVVKSHQNVYGIYLTMATGFAGIAVTKWYGHTLWSYHLPMEILVPIAAVKLKTTCTVYIFITCREIECRLHKCDPVLVLSSSSINTTDCFSFGELVQLNKLNLSDGLNLYSFIVLG